MREANAKLFIKVRFLPLNPVLEITVVVYLECWQQILRQ